MEGLPACWGRENGMAGDVRGVGVPNVGAEGGGSGARCAFGTARSIPGVCCFSFVPYASWQAGSQALGRLGAKLLPP